MRGLCLIHNYFAWWWQMAAGPSYVRGNPRGPPFFEKEQKEKWWYFWWTLHNILNPTPIFQNVNEGPKWWTLKSSRCCCVAWRQESPRRTYTTQSNRPLPLTHHSLEAMGPSPHNMLKGFVRSWLGHSLSRAVLVSVAVSDTRRLSFLYRNIDHERFYNSELQTYRIMIIIILI